MTARVAKPLTQIGAIVVGTGFGCYTQVRALRAAGFDILALVGRDEVRTSDRARLTDVPQALTSVAEALRLPGVQACAVATPPSTHAEIALAALRAGKHVLCEKPFARDVTEASVLLNAAEAAGVVHMVGHEFRWWPPQALLTRLVADGAIGDPGIATVLVHLPVLTAPDAKVPKWWSEAAGGGGWLGASGVHFVDQIRVTLGPFEAVSAGLVNIVSRPWSAEDSYTVRFRLRSGVEGIIQSTAADWAPPMLHTRITGSIGTAWIDKDAVWLANKSGVSQVPMPDDLCLPVPEPPPSGLPVNGPYEALHATGAEFWPYVRLAQSFRDRILGRTGTALEPAPPTFHDGLAVTAVIDAIRESASGRNWVPVRESPTASATADESQTRPNE